MNAKSPLLSRELAALGLDLADTLREEPRFLSDATFIGAVHAELHERLGAGDARAALLQLGFLHGLRDALALVTRGLRGAGSARPAGPRIALALKSAARTQGEAVRGAFRDALEARAVSEVSGAQARACCALSSGYASGWLSGLFDTDLFVRERACCAAGASRCEFEARTPEDWAAADDADGDDLARLPFSPLRDLVARHLAAQPEASESAKSSFEEGTPVTHVWGPVMVIPYAGADETIQGLDLIRRDAGAREVRVVVVDLAGAIIDESFGALELERVLEAIERLGAEPVLTGIAPLSERAVSELEVTHLVVRKDLAAAIAAAFQIADAMKRAI